VQRPLESLPLAPLISYNHVYKIKAIRRLEFTLRKLGSRCKGRIFTYSLIPCTNSFLQAAQNSAVFSSKTDRIAPHEHVKKSLATGRDSITIRYYIVTTTSVKFE
jgi:hypothetical protein